MHLINKCFMSKSTCGLVLLTLGCLAQAHSASAQTLTGSELFGADAGGNFNGVEAWTTALGNGITKLWTYQGTTLRNASVTDPTLTFALTPGIYTFGIYGSNSQNYDFRGMNLFFDGQTTTPGISVKANTLVSASDTSVFTANGGNTLALSGTSFIGTPGANSLTFLDGAFTIQLTAFSWTKPSVNNIDRVSTYAATPDGTPDFVGSYTLKVTNASPIPEASSFISLGLLLVLGMGALTVSRRRKAGAVR